MTTDAIRTLRVLILAFSAFVINTSEFIPVALLSDIGASFAISADTTGIMITIYAWVVALMSLPMMLMTAHLPRKQLLIGTFVLFILSHIGSVIASSFGALIISRIGVALAHALFWSITASLAVRLAPKGRQTWALGLLATGSALATVLGLPLGRMVGQAMSWQVTFGLIGALAFICLIFIIILLPKLPSRNVGDVTSLPLIAKNRPFITIYAIIAIIVTAHFTAYSYTEPIMMTLGGHSTGFATLTLLIFGCAGIVGSYVFSRHYEHRPFRFLITATATMGLSLLIITPVVSFTAAWLGLSFVWGVGLMTSVLALQLLVLKFAPTATDVAMALFSGIFNVGIGAGAFIGAGVIHHDGFGLLGVVGGLLSGLALLLVASCLQGALRPDDIRTK